MELPLMGKNEHLIHVWDQDKKQCPIIFDHGKSSHGKHFMKCSRCGAERFGAYAEPGAFHYFTYQHPNGTVSEVEPPCTVLPSSVETREVKICGKCRDIIHDPEKGCEYGHHEPPISLTGCFLKASQDKR